VLHDEAQLPKISASNMYLESSQELIDGSRYSDGSPREARLVLGWTAVGRFRS
jgi:hypothetical protein